MIPKAAEVRLTLADRAVLEARVRAPTTEQRDVFRARIILLADEGRSTRSIARTLGTMPRTVSAWRGRFAREGLAGLGNKAHPGPAPTYGTETGRRILAVLDREPPAGFARWTGALIAAELGDVHEQYVWRFLRAQKIDLAGRKSWCESDDPEFVAKAADVVGLYMAPPENAIVISVDEKPSIQALERAQGYLKLPNGRALTGHSHDYKRNGTSTLFVAFEVATGKVTAAHKNRRRRVEFLDFMNDIVADHPGTAIHVILDNLNRVHLDGHGNHLNEFGGTFADNVAAQHKVRIRVDNQLHQRTAVAPLWMRATSASTAARWSSSRRRQWRPARSSSKRPPAIMCWVVRARQCTVCQSSRSRRDAQHP